jgi:hypothetical protein
MVGFRFGGIKHPTSFLIESIEGGELMRQLVIGIIMIVVGLVISIGSYESASNGGHYVVTWGLVIAGAVNVFRGIVSRKR